MSYFLKRINKVRGRKAYSWVALDSKVIAVAVEGEIRDWSAYIGAVPGKKHESEYEDVALHGSKLSKNIAEAIFPDFKRLWYRE